MSLPGIGSTPQPPPLASVSPPLRSKGGGGDNTRLRLKGWAGGGGGANSDDWTESLAVGKNNSYDMGFLLAF